MPDTTPTPEPAKATLAPRYAPGLAEVEMDPTLPGQIHSLFSFPNCSLGTGLSRQLRCLPVTNLMHARYRINDPGLSHFITETMVNGLRGSLIFIE